MHSSCLTLAESTNTHSIRHATVSCLHIAASCLPATKTHSSFSATQAHLTSSFPADHADEVLCQLETFRVDCIGQLQMALRMGSFAGNPGRPRNCGLRGRCQVHGTRLGCYVKYSKSRHFPLQGEHVVCMQPQRLSESLAEFEGILSHREVQAAPEVVKTNHENFQTLMHFLKSYTKGLRKDEPLRQQLHTLEFIVPYDSSQTQAIDVRLHRYRNVCQLECCRYRVQSLGFLIRCM